MAIYFFISPLMFFVSAMLIVAVEAQCKRLGANQYD